MNDATADGGTTVRFLPRLSQGMAWNLLTVQRLLARARIA